MHSSNAILVFMAAAPVVSGWFQVAGEAVSLPSLYAAAEPIIVPLLKSPRLWRSTMNRSKQDVVLGRRALMKNMIALAGVGAGMSLFDFGAGIRSMILAQGAGARGGEARVVAMPAVERMGFRPSGRSRTQMRRLFRYASSEIPPRRRAAASSIRRNRGLRSKRKSSFCP